MRHREGIAGATLIYGRGQERPDLLLASQFLIDDLRQEGRSISGVRITRHAMRLRADGFELALSLSDKAIPARAFAGAVRPVAMGAAAPDMARGRVLHALRHHDWVLGLLLRLRGVQQDQSMEARLQALPAACHALSATVAEAAPPLVMVWQGSGLVCTLAEFLALPAGMLDEAGPGLVPLGPVGQGRRAVARPMMPGKAEPVPAPVRPGRALARAGGDQPAPAPSPSPDLAAKSLPGNQEAAPAAMDTPWTVAGAALVPDAAPAGGLDPAAAPVLSRLGGPGPLKADEQPGPARLRAPTNRAARAERQSGGRLFGRKTAGSRVALAAAPGLARHDARLAGALRRGDCAATAGNATAPSQRGAMLRVALICVALALFGPAAAGVEIGGTETEAPPPQGAPLQAPEAG